MSPDHRFPTRRWLPAMAAVCLAAFPVLLQAQDTDPETVRLLLEEPIAQRFVPGEILVRMKPGPAGPESASGPPTLPDLDTEVRETSGGEFLMRIVPSAAETLDAEDLEARTLSMVADLEDDPDVEWAQPNYVLQIARIPNDPRFPDQWHYLDNGGGGDESRGGINLPTAWDRTTGSASVVVAVLDTGILPDHPDITGSPNLIPGFDMVSDSFRGNDGDGRDNDPSDPGDAVQARQCGGGEPPQPRPSSWHGTHVAGTVGVGNTDNVQGVAGVAWRLSLMAVRVLGRCGGTTADIADAVRWASGLAVPGVGANPNPAQVINLSLGGEGTCDASPAMQSAIDDAVAAGTTVVVAAGNSASNAANFTPASCDGVITVAAANRSGKLVTRYSNFGDKVEILAPGGDVTQGQGGVLSMVRNGYERYNGTSMAAPHVAGVVALLLAEEPGLSPAQVLRRLQANVMPRSDGDCPQACGAGLLDADLWSDKLRLSPSGFGLKKGRTRDVVATYVRDGRPQAGVAVSFSSTAPNAVQVTASATTDGDGRAVATVERLASGEATIEARAEGLTAEAPIKVPAASILGFLLAAAAALYLLERRRTAGG